MLEDFINRAAAERLRSSIFGEHLETFCAGLLDRPASIEHKLWCVGALGQWMTGQ